MELEALEIWNDKKDFTELCNNLLKKGWELKSSHVGSTHDSDGTTDTIFMAILIKGETENGKGSESLIYYVKENQKLKEALKKIKECANEHCNDTWGNMNDFVYLTAKEALE